MVSKKVIIGAVVIAAVVIVGALALGGSSSSNARYGYTLELTDDIYDPSAGEYGHYYASEGTQWLVVHWTVANDSVSSGVHLSYFWISFDASIGGVVYTQSYTATEWHPDCTSASLVSEGATASSVTVIPVPDTASLDDIEVSFAYDGSGVTWSRDDTLV